MKSNLPQNLVYFEKYIAKFYLERQHRFLPELYKFVLRFILTKVESYQTFVITKTVLFHEKHTLPCQVLFVEVDAVCIKRRIHQQFQESKLILY